MASSADDAVRVAHQFEEAVRSAGLLPNARKLYVVSTADYADRLRDLSIASDEFRARIQDARTDDLKQMSDVELGALASAYEIDEDAQWRYFYHGAMATEEFRDLIAPFLAPSAIEVLEELYGDATGSGGDLLPELRHARIVYCLQRLAGAKAKAPLATAVRVLRQFPDETDDICSYLLSLADSETVAVAAVAMEFLEHTEYMTDWQRAWILRVLSRCVRALDERAHLLARSVMVDERVGWLARLEAMRVLAASGVLEEGAARAAFARCPEVFKSDLGGVVAANSTTLVWAASFLDGLRDDHLTDVVIKGILDSKR